MGDKEQLSEYKMPDDPTSTDAEWKRIQQNTFTRWCNEHLKCVNLYIHNLETDLCDGLKLIALLQVLSHKKIARYNKKPTFRPQKIENVAIALKFIEDEQIKLVNIDASDILKGNLKLILGLIWTLILKYQISLPMMDDDDEQAKDITPKQALMGWVKSKLPPELHVKNFNKDWNDGIAVASLVESTAPGLFPEWEDLSPENALQNAKEAMKLAEDWLGVPQVITPEEITNPNVDELSVMTYVSYFPEAKVKPGAPLKPKMTDASKCSASGPGLQEHGVVVNNPADFTVFTSGSSRGKLNVQVFGPGRKAIDCMVQDNHDNTYSCQYIGVKQGTYDVHVRVGGHHIPKSPFRVNVASDLDSSKVIARGPGLEPQGLIVGRPAVFEVIATGAGSGDLVIDVIDPKGNKKTELKIEEKPGNVFNCMYMPLFVGRYVIVIKYGGKEVAKSPYHVNVTPAADRVKIYGPGLESGLKTGKPATFTIDCSEAGDGGLDVTVEGPGKSDVKCELKDNGDGTFTCTYKPTKAGQYTVTVKFDNGMVPKCPVRVSVGSTADPSKIKAWGPGLERGVAGRPAEFYVSCKGAPMDNLTVGVEGPAEAKVDIKDDGNGTATIVYFPTKPGKYIIHIMYDEVDIKDSPYTSVVSPRGDVSKVYAEGPGLEAGNMAGKPAEFKVFTKGTGVKGSVQVSCVDESGNPVEVKVKDNGDDTFTVVYYPKAPGKYTITICFMDEPISQSPVSLTIIPFSDASKVRATGPGLQGGKCDKPAKFKIDASKAGEGGIGLTIEGPTEAQIKCDDKGDGTCDVEYLPVEDGDYKINVLFADEHIPGSPFTAVISGDFDASKVKADGPGLKPGNKAGRPCDIAIDTRKAGKAKLNVEVVDEVGNPVKVDLVEEEPGLFASSYYPEKEGPHTVNVTYGGKHVPKSPFKVKVNPSFDASKVKVYGPGIEPEGVKATQPTYFEIDASDAGEGNVDINIEPTGRNMPKVKDIDVKEGKKPNSYIVTYIPPKDGEYVITVTFAAVGVPKSPFKIKVSPGIDASKCKVHGPGIEEPIVGQENVFDVETPNDGLDAPLTCTIESPSGRKVKADVTDAGNNKYNVAWTPKETGRHKLTIKYGDQEVPKSPFYVDVVGKPDPSKVKAYGPGLENAYVGKPAEFTIETKLAGPGNLGLTIEGPEEAKIDCKDNGDGTCSVSYLPTKEGDYEVNILFDDTHIPDSPFKVGATEPVDASKVKCKGPGVSRSVPASLPADFTVDASKAGKAPLEVDVEGPGGEKFPCDIKDNGNGTFDCSYVPEKKGRYNVTPKYGGTPVPGAPFKVSGDPTGDASKVKCSGPGLERPHLGHAAPFEVDASKAGKGNPVVNAKGPKGEKVPVKMVEEEEGIYACEYVPEELGPHELEVLFGGEPVRGSPFKAKATPAPELDKVRTPVLEEVLEAGPCVEQQFEAPVDCSEVPDNRGAKLSGKITTPSGKKEKVDVKDNHDGTFALNYVPKEVGKYILDVGYDGIPIPGSPFEFEVTEGGPDKVKVYGKGIKKGVVAVPSRFTVDTKNAGPGDLSVAVEGPSKVDIECVDNGDGTCEVTYVPVEAGEYDVIVKFDNQQVPGSPFKPRVVQDEPAIEVGSPSDLCMSPEGVSPDDIPSLKGVLEAPSGKEKPVDVSEGPNDSIIASFVPEEPGKNLLHVKKRNKPIKGSPIPVMVREKPVIGEESSIPLECADCEIPKDLPLMKGVLTRPNGKEEPCKVEEGPDNTIAVSFVPEEPGKHLIKVFKDNKQIDDSPFVVNVEGTPDQYPKVGKPCDKDFYQPEPCRRSDISKMKGTLRRPTGKEEPVDVKLGPDGTIAVSFVPTEAGEHLISVKKDGRHVPNSPFSIMVIDEPSVPTVGSDCAANFDIPELDLPKDLKNLTGTLTRPTGKEEPLELGVGPDNSLAINFVPKEPGKHLIGIKKRGKHVKDSPFEIMVDEAKPQGPCVGEECAANFTSPDLDLPRDLKNLTGELERPTGKKEPLPLECAPDNSLAVNFVPTEPGEHKVHVAKRGKPIKDSPFSIMVDDAAPSGPEVGRECGVNLDIPELDLPRDLKSLDAHLTRPTGKKEPLECEVGPDDTLAVAFTPTEPGKHLIDVKKRGRPVKGSPFEVDVAPAGSGKHRQPIDEGIVPQSVGDVESCPDFPDFLPEDQADKEKPATIGSPCDMNLDLPDVDLPNDLDKLKAELTRPSGEKEPVKCSMAPDGSLAIGFTPKEVGKHLVDVRKNRRPVKGSPFEIMVEDAKPERPCVGDKCAANFTSPDLDLPRDLKNLTGELERPTGKKEPLPLECGPDGSLAVNFIPTEPGEHKVHVAKKGKPVKGSPFTIMVDEAKPERPCVGDKCAANFTSPDLDLPRDLKNLTGELERPTGKKEPLPLECGPDGSLAVNFIPTEPGEHKVHVAKRGKPVKGSPFTIMVGDAKPERPCVGDKCAANFTSPDLDLPRDLKNLTGELERPTGKKEPLPLECGPDGSLAVNFVPTEPGEHKVHVAKRGKPVKGSPFTIMVGDAKPERPCVGDKCAANFTSPDLDLPRDLKNLTGELERPTGKKEPLPLECGPDGSLAVNFVPTEPGEHKVHVAKRGKPVKGSPFTIMVDDAKPERPCVGDKCSANFTSPDLDLPRDLKNLTGELERPTGKKEPLPLECAPDNSLAVNFVPTEPGEHKVHVAKRGKPIKDSPFSIMVDDAAPSGPEVGRECGVNLDIPELDLPRDLKSLDAQLTRPTGKKEPLECEVGPDDTLAVAFTPTEPGKHLIDVKKRGRPVKGSPFEVDVAPAGSGKHRQPIDEGIVPQSVGDVESCPDFPDFLPEDQADKEKPATVGSPCDVNLDLEGVELPDDLDKLKAELTRPSGEKEPIKCSMAPDGSLAIGFTPKEVGKHLVDVRKNRRPVKGSPFEIMVEEATSPDSKPTVGNKCDVDFDIPDIDLPADLKHLNAELTRPTGKKEAIPCTCSPENTLGLEFTPTEPGKHVIDVTKRGRPVKGSPFEVMVEEEEPVSKVPTVGTECDVNLEIPGLNLPRDFKYLEGSLKRPGKRSEEPLELTLNPNNTIGVTFVPEKPGRHEISIKKNGKHVSGSPFEVMVEDAPSAVQEPQVGSPVDVCVDMTIDPDELRFIKATLERPDGTEEPIDLKLNHKNQPIVTFTPKQPGLHKVNLKRRGKHLPGSPIEVMVSPGKKKPTCDVGFEIPGIKLPEDLKYMKGSVVSPSGKEEPVDLQAGPNNTILVSFLPKEVGRHLIHIKKNGRPVGDSPYEVMVKPEDLAPGKPDASKVKCTGKGLRGGRPNEKAEFTVDTRDAGYGGLGLSVEGPSKVEINCIDNEDGTCSVDYTPTEPGQYLINVTYADEHVPGSPFKCRIGDGRVPVDDEIVPISEDGVQAGAPEEFSDMLAFPSSKAHSPQDFVIKFSGTGDLKASVTRPSGIEDDAEVVETGPDTYTVRFVPRETGEHLVNVKSGRRHIPGSPFKVLVEAPAGGAAACKAYGPGLEGGNAGRPLKFTVITRDAGPGGLAVAVEGPAKAEIQCHDNGDGSCDITWYPVESGEYTVHIRFADEAIPGSPYKVFVQPADQGKAMPMESFKDEVLRVGQPASFAVQMKGKKGKITASVTSPAGAQIDCNVAEHEEGNYAVRFVPRELGDHLVSVFLDGHHIPGSPFTVRVGGLEGDPSKVVAYGPGLKGGVAGRPAEFIVNALDAGSGALALSIDGPAKVKMNCVEQDDGTYKVIYNPTVTGIYEISIRFAGQHITNSPYKVRIVESEDQIDAINITGDASKCTSKGPGLRRANVGEPATFTVNASNAGRGSLMVGVEGPVIPAKEIIVKHTGNNVYSVNYVLEESGNYVLKILWADSHIPGSPFHVTV
ncbi:filamin-B-like isoform X3 [Hydractinia symbiolongicarpus]|uniref:filamin-B-like isoform X3 n=1 Tax=Hydractinia symbiolongicarpus TaxID=13093 RepID=UPI0025504814|nr:filamin-B-like isoform X3 [Hydractinia symbiolongicarpus]